MATLTVQDASKGIENLVMSAASAGGDTVAAGVKPGGWELPVVLVARNGDVAAKTVTVSGVAYNVPASGIALIPIRGGVYYGAVTAITYSAVTSVTVGAATLAKL